MKRTFPIAVLLLLSIVIGISTFSACNFGTTSSEDEVVLNIKSTNFKDVIDRTQNLNFIFNEDVMPDSLTSVWDTIPYVVFNPKVPGMYKWKSRYELVFSPNQAFAPSTDFEITPGKALLELVPKHYKLGDEVTTCHTPYLALDEVNAYWKKSVNQVDKAAVGAKLLFNSEIEPKALKDKLSVTVNGKKHAFEIMNMSPNSSVEIEVQNIDLGAEQSEIIFAITEGFSIEGSNWVNKESMEKKVTLESPTRMKITDVKADHDGTEGRIDVSVSQQIIGDNIKTLVTLDPDVKFEVETHASGFTLVSDAFDAVKTYDIKISKNIKGIFGGRIFEEYKENITFGKLEPSIKFVAEKATYLSNKAFKNVGLKIVNVPEVKVKVTKVFQQNIQQFLRNRKDDSYYREYDQESGRREYHNYYYYQTEKYGELVFEADYKTEDLDRLGKVRLLNLDFEDKIAGYDGVYVVEVRDKEKHFLTDSKIISYSDIGLIVKQSGKQIHVFANSISEAKPISNAIISFVSESNQEFHNVQTNGQGAAVYNLEEDSPFDATMITATKGSDFNYVILNKTTVNASRFDVGGRHFNSANYECFIYGDRDLYRPGETVNISTIVRNLEWGVPAEIPVVIKMLLPNGKEYKTIRKTLNKQGACETNIQIPASMVTGTYAVEVYTGNDILLNSKPISVEEFMPDRIKVEVKTDKEEYMVGDSIKVEGLALNLFGPPAPDRDYEVELSLNRAYFGSPDFENYTFNLESQKRFGRNITEGKTEKDGTFTADFGLPLEYANMGVLKGKCFATVFDESGRPVNRIAPFKVITQDKFIGIGSFGYYLSTRNNIEMPLVALDKDGEVLNDVEVMVQIIRYKWRTVLESASRGRYRYKSQKEEIVEESKNIILSGADNTFSYQPDFSGRYEIRVSLPDSKSYVTRSFRAYRWGDTQSTSFEVNQEGKIDIAFDKAAYEVGEQAKVLFKTPFNGRLLVTVEREEVMQYAYLETNNKAAEMTLPVSEEFLPNVFISATLVRPTKKLNVPLTVAHGYAPLKAKKSSNELPITIEAAKKSRSKTKQLIKVKTAPNAELAIAVVDEGILQIKDYKTPDPYAFFYQKRALKVSSHDIYPYLFPEMVAGEMLTGGDGMDMGKRVNPITNKRVKLISNWSGIIQADASGTAEYEIDIPQFSGDLRVMAVAYKDAAFASADENMKVADPVVISTGLPRFLSPGDTITVPVTMSNTTKTNADGQVALKVEGPLSIIGEASATTSLAANSENRQIFKLVADKSVGPAKISVGVDALNETFSEVIDISVRPPASLQKISGAGSIQAGNSVNLDTDNSYVPESIDGQLIVSASPLVEFSDDLRYLVRYPHGCVEQTISKAFPQMYFAELVKSIPMKQSARISKGNNARNPNYNVQQAIKKLQSMQLSSGGLSYWQGGASESWWGSVFAAHFLYEAKQADFEVSDAVLEDLITYLRKKLNKKETFNYYYNNGTERTYRKVARKEIPYSLYVLSLAGKPVIPMMNYYKSNLEELSLDGRYLVAAAYAMAGDKSKFAQVLPTTFANEKSEKEFGGSFSSPIRDRAIALNALLASDPNHPQVGTLGKHLVTDYKKEEYLSTQERVFTFLAFGKIAKAAAAGNITASITAGGQEVAQFNGTDVNLKYSDFAAGKVAIDVQGSGNLYYYWNLEGLTSDGSFVEEDSYLKIRKTFYDRFGREIKKMDFRQNDLIVVKLSLISTGSNNVENVVVTDILPAGFEVENPRIGELPEMEWIKDASKPQHQDFRDDRVHLFTTATDDNKDFYYMVRAVTPGSFIMGPASADAMYNGEYHSYNGGGMVKVNAR